MIFILNLRRKASLIKITNPSKSCGCGARGKAWRRNAPDAYPQWVAPPTTLHAARLQPGPTRRQRQEAASAAHR